LEELNADDIVIIPAFGTTLETEQKLRQIGIDPLKYNTTCPFVEKVWNRSEQIGTKGHTIIIHGKPDHEETRATFSHSSVHAPALVIRDMQEAQLLAEYITQKKSSSSFFIDFKGQYSAGFNPALHLQFIGVVNQTTMLASETQGIADYLKGVIIQQFGEAENHFADTRDTLCYATNDNQSAVQGMLSTEADLAIVIGGYNSSNTSHLVELCEKKLPTYYIENQDNISDEGSIRHYDFHLNQEKNTKGFLPQSDKTRILISSGASCPDAIVEKVIQKLQGFYPNSRPVSELIEQFQ
jgi:4-hydroxy-3-methylbut-2-enyl diphosphate reductase